MLGNFLILSGILAGFLGLWSYWRDFQYEKASIAVRATVKSVEIEPIRSGLSNILYTLRYKRDGVMDVTHHKITQQYTIKEPLQTSDELQKASFYIRYVPTVSKTATEFPGRVIVSEDKAYEGFYNRALFGQMFTLLLFGAMVRKFAGNKAF